MRKIIVSACLFGQPVRYDGKSKAFDNDIFNEWKDDGRMIVVCPELLGGLETPRPETQIRDGKAINIEGEDVTEAFTRGAQRVLELANEHEAAMILLKEKSPSCGVNLIHDGSFTGRKIEGSGITASLLKEAGYPVFSEEQIDEAAEFLNRLESEDEMMEMMMGLRL